MESHTKVIPKQQCAIGLEARYMARLGIIFFRDLGPGMYSFGVNFDPFQGKLDVFSEHLIDLHPLCTPIGCMDTRLSYGKEEDSCKKMRICTR